MYQGILNFSNPGTGLIPNRVQHCGQVSGGNRKYSENTQYSPFLLQVRLVTALSIPSSLKFECYRCVIGQLWSRDLICRDTLARSLLFECFRKLAEKWPKSDLLNIHLPPGLRYLQPKFTSISNSRYHLQEFRPEQLLVPGFPDALLCRHPR